VASAVVLTLLIPLGPVTPTADAAGLPPTTDLAPPPPVPSTPPGTLPEVVPDRTVPTGSVTQLGRVTIPPRTLTRPIEPLRVWSENTERCRGRVSAQQGVKQFRSFIMEAFPKTRDYGIARSCRATFGSPTSQHKEGRAWDWGVSARRARDRRAAAKVIDWLLATDAQGNRYANARRVGLMYIIWNGRLWTTTSPEWRRYTSYGGHYDHVHFSFTWAGARGLTSFWRNKPRYAGPLCSEPAQPVPARGPGDTTVVEIPETVIADTRPHLPSACTFAPGDARGSVQVAGLNGVPASGVVAVRARIQTTKPDRTTSIRVGGWSDAALAATVKQDDNFVSEWFIAPLTPDGRLVLKSSRAPVGAIVWVNGYVPGQFDLTAPPAPEPIPPGKPEQRPGN